MNVVIRNREPPNSATWQADLHAAFGTFRISHDELHAFMRPFDDLHDFIWHHLSNLLLRTLAGIVENHAALALHVWTMSRLEDPTFLALHRDPTSGTVPQGPRPNSCNVTLRVDNGAIKDLQHFAML
jgi:hypothetical protein